MTQAGETTLLRKLAKDFECQKWIIDVGANDGVTISNPLPVELGWRAILIEPAPAVFKKPAANYGGRDKKHFSTLFCFSL